MAICEGLPRAIPEDMGMSTSRLARITPVMQGYVITMNHISDDWQPNKRTGSGFGLGFSVVTNVADTHTLGSLGTCSWGGMASTTFWIDPVEELIGIFMTQLVGADSPFHAQFRVLTYQALTD